MVIKSNVQVASTKEQVMIRIPIACATVFIDYLHEGLVTGTFAGVSIWSTHNPIQSANLPMARRLDAQYLKEGLHLLAAATENIAQAAVQGEKNLIT